MLIRGKAENARARAAFTLMEVLIVVAILVVLASVSSIYVFKFLDDSKKQTARLKMDNLTTVARACQLKTEFNGAFPQTLQEMGPYLETADAIVDPWGNEFKYDPTGANNGGRKPDISTVAPDGELICNWARTGG